jgi:Ca2+:H+ antiporter
MELPVNSRLSLYHRLVPSAQTPSTQRGSASLHRKPSIATNLGESNLPSRSQTPLPRDYPQPSTSAGTATRTTGGRPSSPSLPRRVSYATVPQHPGFTPVMESVDHVVKNTGLQTMHLPENMTTDDFTRAVAVATVSALRHQQAHPHSPARVRGSGGVGENEAGGGHGGHDAPSWSRTTSASVLLGCTALYALIAGTRSFF